MSVYDAAKPDVARLQAAQEADADLTAALLVDDPVTRTRYRMDPPCSTAPEEFFHTAAVGSSGVTPAALALCGGCPAQEECAVYAGVAGEKFGTWGGLPSAAIRRAYKAGGADAVRASVQRLRSKLPAGDETE